MSIGPFLPWPHLERNLKAPWMMFVDGENLTIQGQKVAKRARLDLLLGPFYQPDVFLWLPGYAHSSFLSHLPGVAARHVPAPTQSHYYTSMAASERDIHSVMRKVREAGFKPHVFKKARQGAKSKGVDISLARDLLVHGFEGAFSYALLVAGDQDYLPLVEEMQSRRIGVLVAFFDAGMGPKLRTEADFYFPLDQPFLSAWDEYLFPELGRHGIQVGEASIRVTFHAKRLDPLPTTEHTEVDHVRLALDGRSCRVSCPAAFNPPTAQDEVRPLVERLLAAPGNRSADFVREAL